AMPPPTTRTCCFGAIPPTLPMAGRRAHDVSGLDADDRHARLDDDLLGQRPEDELGHRRPAADADRDRRDLLALGTVEQVTDGGLRALVRVLHALGDVAEMI